MHFKRVDKRSRTYLSPLSYPAVFDSFMAPVNIESLQLLRIDKFPACLLLFLFAVHEPPISSTVMGVNEN